MKQKTSKVWKLKPIIPEDLVHQSQGYDGLFAQLLYNRGLTDRRQVDEFVDSRYEGLHNPFLFKDMQKAVKRIWQAVERREKICIYGDYDADAITANAVLRRTFRHLGHQNIESYIPDRFSEGYGVNTDALLKIKDNGAKIIITVDCGTNAVEAGEFCKTNGIDFIITDHHEIIGPAPHAFALINPKNPNDGYLDDQITGVGVAFKMACAILNSPESRVQSPELIKGWEKWLLDLVAIGTVADCHALLGENRILVKYGLVVLAKTKWLGLQALIASSGLNFSARPPDSYTLGFILAPRLNAAGRLEHANTALDLLLEEDILAAKVKASKLEELNRRRQETTAVMLSEAREKALGLQERKVLVIMNESWHKGVVGLVAGKLAEEFYKPTFILSLEKGEATGSARAVGQFNVVEALRFSSRHLVRFGGHRQAAGLSLRPENFEIFYQTILDYAENNLADGDVSPSLELEAELLEEDLQLTTCNLLANLEPFGVGNPRPKFLIRNVRIISQRQVGTDGRHLQAQVQIGEKIMPAIAFNFRSVDSANQHDLACELLEDGWNGRKQLKLKIVDVQMSKN
ncbi:MAG: single-stranded-DNA-specific exonuclease RecJ [Candidatus Doudnabacteria bacterium]|nr:single-stranded-DNA-specific exonuclease RecJ [Candidatus Doudnabacteria bacterium]